MPRTLYLLRHAKSSWDSPAARDFDRPLASRGEKAARLMGNWMEAQGILPKLIVSSPALRAQQTIENVATQLALPPDTIRYDERIYMADPDTLLDLLAELPDDETSIMLVGHNPGLDDLLFQLCGNDLPLSDSGKLMTTATLAIIQLHENSGQLIDIIRPKEIHHDANGDFTAMPHLQHAIATGRNRIQPEQETGVCLKILFRSLYETAQDNEPGILANTDPEHLHDFRVALRKTLSILKRVNDVFPTQTVERFTNGFAWLLTETAPLRDLHVYLQKLADHAAHLPPDILPDLVPFNRFLQQRQDIEYRKLIRQLGSVNYRELIQAWQGFLDEPETATLTNTHRPIKPVASEVLLRTHRKVMKRGKAINETSSPEAFHRLRISCKKLRYLLELFRPLYSAKRLDMFIYSLKALQDTLGDYQDLHVEMTALQSFLSQMQNETDTSEQTTHAILQLIEYLDEQQDRKRQHYDNIFDEFSRTTNESLFEGLVAD